MNVKKFALPLSLVLAAAGLAGAASGSSSTSSTSTLAQRPPAQGQSAQTQPGNQPGRPDQPGGPNGAGPRAPMTAQNVTSLIQSLGAKATDPDAKRLLTEARALAAKGSQDPRYLRAALDLVRAAATLSGQNLGMGHGGRGRGPGGPGMMPGAQSGAPTAPTPPAGK